MAPSEQPLAPEKTPRDSRKSLFVEVLPYFFMFVVLPGLGLAGYRLAETLGLLEPGLFDSFEGLQISGFVVVGLIATVCFLAASAWYIFRELVVLRRQPN